MGAAGEVASPGDGVVATPAARADRALLYVGQPEQAEVPPVPSQRPSPGQVPAPMATSGIIGGALEACGEFRVEEEGEPRGVAPRAKLDGRAILLDFMYKPGSSAHSSAGVYGPERTNRRLRKGRTTSVADGFAVCVSPPQGRRVGFTIGTDSSRMRI